MNEKMRSSVMGLIMGQFSSPLPISQKEPVAYLYNGVRLPALPEWDKEAYPYAVIWYTPGFFGIGSYYYLIISQTEIVTDATSSEKFTVGADAIVYSINAPYKPDSGDTWKESTFSGGAYSGLRWSNYDVYDAEGTMKQAASDVVTVYGYETVFSGDITLTAQESGVPANLAYRFDGIGLTKDDFKEITFNNTLFLDITIKGFGNLGNAELYDTPLDLVVGTDKAADFWYFYFDDQGVPWLVSTYADTVNVTIVKYITK